MTITSHVQFTHTHLLTLMYTFKVSHRTDGIRVKVYLWKNYTLKVPLIMCQFLLALIISVGPIFVQFKSIVYICNYAVVCSHSMWLSNSNKVKTVLGMVYTTLNPNCTAKDSNIYIQLYSICLLYTSDAADE